MKDRLIPQKGLLAAVVLALAVVTVAAGQAWVIARVSFYMGEVNYMKAQSDQWSGVSLKQPLFSGDIVRTDKESRLELKTGEDDLIVRIDEDSELEISNRSLQEWKGAGTKATLKKGRLWTNVRRMAADRENLTIETPTVLAAVRGTVFRIDIPSEVTTILRVYEGELEVRDNPNPPAEPGQMREVAPPREVPPPREVSPQEWLELVSANQQLTVTRGKPPSKIDFDPAADAKLDWVKWNKERDKLIEPPPEPPERRQER